MDCLGCLAIVAHPVTLQDGRTVCTSCPSWRFETECRYVVDLVGHAKRTEYLAGVEQQRGKVAAGELRAGAWAMMRAKK